MTLFTGAWDAGRLAVHHPGQRRLQLRQPDARLLQGLLHHPVRLQLQPRAAGRQHRDGHPTPMPARPPAAPPSSPSPPATDQHHLRRRHLPAGLGRRSASGVDTNANGVQDSGEPGLAGATVTLFTARGSRSARRSPPSPTAPTASAAWSPGSYKVCFTTPSGYTFSPTGQGTPSTDSDAGATAGLLRQLHPHLRPDTTPPRRRLLPARLGRRPGLAATPTPTASRTAARPRRGQRHGHPLHGARDAGRLADHDPASGAYSFTSLVARLLQGLLHRPVPGYSYSPARQGGNATSTPTAMPARPPAAAPPTSP